MAACPPTPREPAAANTAGPHSPPTGPPAEPTVTTSHAHPAQDPSPTDTFLAAGGALRFGTPPATPPDWTRVRAPTTFATPTRLGCSLGAPTSKSSVNDLATAP